MSEKKHLSGEKIYTTDGKYTIQYGYQPNGNSQVIRGGYVPTGQKGKNENTENNPPSPPSGGSAQQDD